MKLRPWEEICLMLTKKLRVDIKSHFDYQTDTVV